MQKFSGKIISPGVALGRIYYYDTGKTDISRRYIDDADAECARFEAALEKADGQLEELYSSVITDSGRENAAIFQAQQLILQDNGYISQIKDMIKNQHVCSEYAVDIISGQFADMLSKTDDEYMRERSMDIKDVAGRLLRILDGRSHDLSVLPDKVMIAADTLSASDVACIDRSKILGFICGHISSNSHAAILIRSMNIPAISGIQIDKSFNDRQAALLADSGCMVLDPDENTLQEAEKFRQEADKQQKLLQELKGKPAITGSGRQIRIYANAGSLSDIDAAADNDAEGIGLMRSEFLYLESKELPSEEKQFETYKAAALKMHDKPLIIRTADLGSDKQPAYLKMDKEDNPALGLRGIRMSLSEPEMFITQLRAIYRASAFGKISVMFPMITSIDEVMACKKYAADVQTALKNEGVAFDEEVRLGIMIETPAAALISETLAKEVDFLSIGTNDLAQYTLAADRGNDALSVMSDTHHPAVLELIRLTIENGHKSGAVVGICGELAADTGLTGTFISYGVDILSVSPSFILPLRSVIISDII